MYLPVLKKDESYYIMIGLLQGEVNEVKEALTKYQVTGNPMERDELAGELLDVIQIAIGGLDKLTRDGLDLEEATARHLKKLINRQVWTVSNMLKIEVL